MDWLNAIIRAFAPPQSARTPDFNPASGGQTQPGGGGTVQTGGGTANQPNWLLQLLPFLVGAGTNLAGTALQARSTGNQNEALRERAAMMDNLARDEMKRRDFYASTLLPNLLKGTGYRNPQIAQVMDKAPLLYRDTPRGASPQPPQGNTQQFRGNDPNDPAYQQGSPLLNVDANKDWFDSLLTGNPFDDPRLNTFGRRRWG